MAEITWAHPVSGEFNDAKNWRVEKVPGPGDDASFVTEGAAFTVDTAFSETVDSLQTSANATLAIGVESGTFTATDGTGAGVNAGTISVGDGAIFQVGGTLDNTGVIALSLPGPDSGAEMLVEASTTLSGGGRVVLADTGAGLYPGNAIEGVPTLGTLVNVDNVISGSGLIGGDGLSLINESKGVIDADGVNFDMVLGTETFNGPTVINEGLIESTGAAGLIINGVYLRASGGTILAAAGSKITIEGSDVVGGSGNDAFDIGAGGAIAIMPSGEGASNIITSTVQAEGVVSNAGSISIVASDLVVREGGVTLEGGGVVTLGPDELGNPGRIVDLSVAGVLTNVDNTIDGEGTLSVNLTNEANGVILASGPEGLTLGGTSYTFSNAGVVEAAGDDVTILGVISNSGTLEVAGGTLTADGAVAGDGRAVIVTGDLDLTSSFSGNVTFTSQNGVLDLGDSRGFTGTVTGLSADGGTLLDLQDIPFTASERVRFSADATGGVLTVDDGGHVARFTLVGDFTGDAFFASSDGHGGTSVVEAPAVGQADWTGAVSSDFTDPGNWTGGVTPGAFTDVILDATGPAFTVNLSTDRTVNSIQTASGATLAIGSGTFDAIEGTGAGANAGTIIVQNGAVFEAGGTLDNSGEIDLDSTSEPTVLRVASSLELMGGGTITLNSGFVAAIGGTSFRAALSNVDNTITGHGEIGFVEFDNESGGVVETGSGESVEVLAYRVTDTNSGTLEAVDGGTLYVSGAIDNSDGVILAADLSTVVLAGATIDGGDLTTSGSGGFDVLGMLPPNGKTTKLVGTTTMVSVTGPVDVQAGAWLDLIGTIGLAGQIEAAGGRVILEGADIVGGTIGSSGSGSVRASGSGNVLDGSASAVEIDGDMTVEQGASITGLGTVNLSGKLVAEGSATLEGPLTNTGAIETVGGTVTVDGAVSGVGEALIAGGTISLGSTFSQKVVFDGGGQLNLADSQGYGGMVWKFSTSGATSLDLQDIAFAGATVSYSGTAGQGVLTVTSGARVAHIIFKGDYRGTAFSLSEDANGGTIVIDNVDTPTVATIAQAMAGFAPAQAASAGATHVVEHHALVVLSQPGTATV